MIGDNPKDDYEMPRSAGIGLSFIIDRHHDRSAESTDSLIFVRDFEQIADLLIAARR